MKTTKTTIMAVLAAGIALSAASGAWGKGPADDPEYREAVQAAADAVRDGIAKAPIPPEDPVAILPIRGDADGLLAGRLKIALTDAGKACVETAGDPMWQAVLDELEWNERKEDILDPATVDLISRRTLQSAKYLVTGRLRAERRTDGRWKAEVELHATQVATARHAWGGVYGRRRGLAPYRMLAEEEPSPLNAGVEVRGVVGIERTTDEVETWVKGRLADLGYRVGTGRDDDLTLSLDVEGRLYDRTGEWETYKGELKAQLDLGGAAPRLLGKQNIPADGKPGLGPNGQRNLAYAMEEQLGDWLKRTLDPGAVALAAIRLDLTLADSIEDSSGFSSLETVRRTIAGMDGVRSVRLLEQDDAAGTVAYKVVYDGEAYPGGFVNALFAKHPGLVDRYLD